MRRRVVLHPSPLLFLSTISLSISLIFFYSWISASQSSQEEQARRRKRDVRQVLHINIESGSGMLPMQQKDKKTHMQDPRSREHQADRL
ncbi:hypothetical protein J5N97_008388 [Dioscorea zingiberensis]|uniref:Uncharacterized protein n=1 Tax=Dioscorea zingiberensis TaxID=325984 RepID=A0A9D5HKV1_9LILI|nr:hypothetical protein J5N97_008388 [Dioscorea zingiberensis]